jgi:hypothetical protein
LVTAAAKLRARCRRFGRLLAFLVVALAALPAMALGPGVNVAAHLLGATMQHHCACGMTPGHCGCPECERLERVRQTRDELAAEPGWPCPVLSGACDDGAVPSLHVLPPAILPAAEGTSLECRAPPEPSVAMVTLVPRHRGEPPTRPPRAR